MSYAIRNDYQTNKNAGEAPYIDTWDNSTEYQFWVYHQVKQLAEYDSTILDLGCGYGWKLRYWIQPVCPNITGIDLPDIIDYCVREHNFGSWKTRDLSTPPDNYEPEETYDIIVCSDIIEHLPDPNTLFDWIRFYSHEGTVVVLSTPNRDMIYDPDHVGPPGNPSHYREWDWEEFANFIEASGFTIMSHVPVVAKKNQNEVPVNQMIVAVP